MHTFAGTDIYFIVLYSSLITIFRMADKCPQYSALPSPVAPYGACYKHVHSVSIPLSPSSAAPAAIATSPGMGLLAAPNASKFGTVIPSRIFVGGIDFRVSAGFHRLSG